MSEYTFGDRQWDRYIERIKNEGRDETKRQNVINFYKNGVSVDVISKSVGITEKEVLEIIGKAK